MAISKERINELVEELKQHRDELKVKMHLAKADAKDEWEKLEKRMEALEAKLEAKKESFGDVVEDASDNVEAALELAAEELKKGYQQIRKMF